MTKIAANNATVFPPVLGAVADAFGGNTQKAFFIPLIGFVIAIAFPIYLNIFKRKSLDGWTEKVKVGIEEPTKDIETGFDEKEGGATQIEKM